MIYHLQAGGPEKPVVQFQSTPKGLRTGGANAVSPSLSRKAQELGDPKFKADEDGCLTSNRRRIHPSSASLP